MADQHEDQIIPEEDEGDQYIDTNEVEVELQDDADYPMEEEDEDDIATESAAGPSRSVENNSVQDFHSHDGSVFSVACHPTEPLAATGGEDDVGYIWDITDGEVIEKLTGHTDSVTSIAFSTDGEMIATGGMDGKVRVWRRVGKENYRIWEFLTELQGPDEVMVRKVLRFRFDSRD
jgi:ribosome assembly protein SQT1